MDNKFKLLKKKMTEGVASGVFPGATFAIVLGDITYVDSVGYKALYPKKELNSIDTQYDLASLSKVITVNNLIFQLIDEQKISINDKIFTYLPNFINKEVTIYNILTHTSGLPPNIKWDDINTKEAYIERILNTKLIYEIGTQAIYSDIAFILLGLIIEKILGKPLDECAEERIFKKLNMKDTTYQPKDIKRCAPTEKIGSEYLRGTVHDRKANLFNGISGHAGLFSKVEDLVNYAKMILNNGIYNNEIFIKRETLNLCFGRRLKDDRGYYRSVGFISGKNSIICDYMSEKTICHGGFTGTSLLIDIENKLAIIILSNRVHPHRKDKEIIKKFKKEFNNLVYELFILENIVNIKNSK